jgi:hypothetical protein
VLLGLVRSLTSPATASMTAAPIGEGRYVIEAIATQGLCKVQT